MSSPPPSYPVAFLERMKVLLKKDYVPFVESLEEPAPTSIRLNPKKSISNFDNEEAIPWCPDGRYLKKRPSFTFDPLFHAGSYYVQEASSMFLGEVWKQFSFKNEPLKVLDLCAAPGGKSTHLLSLLNGNGLLVTNEVIPNRNRILQQNIIKWGYPNCIITQNKPEDFANLGEYFDVILVDAPCSGEGLFRKDKAAINEWSEQNVELCSMRQKEILSNAMACLKRGGYLIYSTCTFEPEENDENIEQLPVAGCQLSVEQPGVTKTKYGYQLFPHKVKGEGFYIAVVKKEGESLVNQTTFGRSSAEKSITLQHLKNPSAFAEFKKNDLYFALPKHMEDDLRILEKQLYIRNAGICMGSIKGKDFLPSHDLAMSIEINKDIPALELDKEQAIQFLRGDAPKVETKMKGWCIVQYEEMNLGWAKVLENRMNNYYPKEFRILKQ